MPPQESPTFQACLVGDAELQHFRFAAFDHINGFRNDRAFNAAAGNRTQEIAFVVDHQIGADRPRRRTPCFDDGCQGDTAPGFAPFFGGFENVFIASQH